MKYQFNNLKQKFKEQGEKFDKIKEEKLILEKKLYSKEEKENKIKNLL